MLSESFQLTVSLDVFQLDQNSPGMKAQLLLSEAEYEGARAHFILCTTTLATRAWYLSKAATRKRSHVPQSLKCGDRPQPGQRRQTPIHFRLSTSSFRVVSTTGARCFQETRASKYAGLDGPGAHHAADRRTDK
jgi:hypothetical protein